MEPDEVLSRVYEAQRAEIEYRRNRENEIFSWSSTILIGFVGAAALFTREKAAVLLQTWPGALLLATLMAIVTTLSTAWQLKQRKFLADAQKTMVEVEKAMGFYANSSFQAPSQWSAWGTRNVTLRDRIFHPSKILATVLLGGIAVLAPFFSVCFAPTVQQSSERVTQQETLRPSDVGGSPNVHERSGTAHSPQEPERKNP